MSIILFNRTSLQIFICSLYLFTGLDVWGQAELLQSGPMIGYSTMREVGVWAQTTVPAEVYFEYRMSGSDEDWMKSPSVTTRLDEAHIAKVVIGYLEPGTTYDARVVINGEVVELDYPVRFQTQKLWQYREDPPDFSFIAGSCLFINQPEYDRPGKPYGQDIRILNAMGQEDVDFMMWLGDNSYLREVDYDSQTGIYQRFTRDRSIPELQPILGKMHHYAIWDDHDYGPNDSDRYYHGKAWTEKAFNLFWMNQTTNLTGKGGITSTFYWADCQFFLIDNRYHRTKHMADKSQEWIYGEDQVQWLIECLRASRATYKFVCVGGQFLSDAALWENHATYAKERLHILDLLDQYDIHGVVFLSGDRHSSEVTRLQTDKGNVFYDITSSAITSKTYDHSDEPNTLRLEGSMIGQNNYAILDVTGGLKERRLFVTFKDIDGQDLYRTEIVFPPYQRR